jgi:hypothetical protein
MQLAFHKHTVRLLKTPIELRGGTVVVCAKYLAADGAQLVKDNIAYNSFLLQKERHRIADLVAASVAVATACATAVAVGADAESGED